MSGSRWLAKRRAFPSAMAQGCEVLIGHDSHGTRASVRNALSRSRPRVTGSSPWTPMMNWLRVT